MKFFIKLDISFDGDRFRFRDLLAPLKWILPTKRNCMNLLSLFKHRVEEKVVETLFVEEFEYLKRDYIRYVGKTTVDGVIHLWGHSTENDTKYFFGVVKDGIWQRAGDFYNYPFSVRKRAQLMFIVIEQGLTKPYGFWQRYPNLYN